MLDLRRPRPQSQRFMTRPGQRAAGAATGAQEPATQPQTPVDSTPGPPRVRRRTWPPRPGRRTRWAIWLAAALVTAAVSIGVALKVAPLQTVTVAGQVIKVGTTAPTLSFSGPGEIDLFGQSLPTHVRGDRPRRETAGQRRETHAEA